eukprot:1158601-Pelagomonas_calceolata.AAC.2
MAKDSMARASSCSGAMSSAEATASKYCPVAMQACAAGCSIVKLISRRAKTDKGFLPPKCFNEKSSSRADTHSRPNN